MPATYKIPQNVDLEDKIFGPFTLKQFLYMLAAGLITFLSFSILYPLSPLVFGVITFLAWVVAAAFVFIRPNDQPFSKFIYSFLWFTIKPQQRVWKRIPSLGEVKLHDETPEVEETEAGPSEEEIHSKLQKLAHLVDNRGWSDEDRATALGNRITSEEVAQRVINVGTTDSDMPEDILTKEEAGSGSDRVSAELDSLLKNGVPKPTQNETKASNKPATAG